jgi:UDP-2-acetamido-3-amino-2,3-dideoxy-glucuronate N-acetyltransferase
MTVHESAYVDRDARVDDTITVGEGTKIWQFATVLQGTVLGKDCNVGACAVLTGAVFGDRCKISSGVVMGPGFQIGNDVFIGPNVVLANDLYPFTDKSYFDEEALRSGEKWCVIIEDGVGIGANTVILPGTRVRRGALVAAGSVCSGVVAENRIYRRSGTATIRESAALEKRMRYVRTDYSTAEGS